MNLRRYLHDLVCSWQDGTLAEGEVLERAEEIWESEDLPHYPETDPRSIAVEVLNQLSILNIQLICRKDIGEILLFLSTPEGAEDSAWRQWRQYWGSIDYNGRAKELRNNDLYLTRGGDLVLNDDTSESKKFR